MSQVPLNLLNNSIDAIENSEKKWIHLSVQELGFKSQFTIIDSGKGISADLQAKTFSPFFSTKKIEKGTGLGLSSCKKIAESHDDETLVTAMGPTAVAHSPA